MKVKFADVKDYIPLVVSLMVLLSVVKSMGYYYVFGIRIADYISFSEAAMLFIDYTLVVCSRILNVGIYVLIVFLTIKFFYRNREKDILLPKKSIVQMQYILVIPAVLFSIYVYILLRRHYLFSFWDSLTFTATFVAIFAVWLVNIFKGYARSISVCGRRKGRLLLYYKRLGIKLCVWFIVLLLVGVTLQHLYLSIRKIGPMNTNNRFVYYFTDSTRVRSGPDTHYVGRTKNNIFFYVPKNRKALVFKEENVQRNEIRNLREVELVRALF